MSGVAPVMREFKHHTLRSSSGRKVTNRKQAIAIGLSEERRMGHRVAPKPVETGPDLDDMSRALRARIRR